MPFLARADFYRFDFYFGERVIEGNEVEHIGSIELNDCSVCFGLFIIVSEQNLADSISDGF
jgi:hypothetical protein